MLLQMEASSQAILFNVSFLQQLQF